MPRLKIKLKCKYQTTKENDPWIYCSYFKDENVICGCVGIEEMCDIYQEEIKKGKAKYS